MTDANLYDTDILLWSEQQGALLRRRAAGELTNEPNFDWENIAEEIESVGNEQLHAVESFLVQALLHDLKAQAWPRSHNVPHWRAEARRFHDDALRRYTPSMRQRIDVPDLYRQAVRAMPETMGEASPQPVPDACPWTIDQMLDPNWLP